MLNQREENNTPSVNTTEYTLDKPVKPWVVKYMDGRQASFARGIRREEIGNNLKRNLNDPKIVECLEVIKLTVFS